MISTFQCKILLISLAITEGHNSHLKQKREFSRVLLSVFIMLPWKQSPSQKMAIEKEETGVCGEIFSNLFFLNT